MRVDLPALGLPIIDMKPDLKAIDVLLRLMQVAEKVPSAFGFSLASGTF
jgi:hypothetical protein